MEYDLETIKKHNTLHDCWMVVHGKVYDVSKFTIEHPGGDLIMDGAGKDATNIFEDIGHSDFARELLDKYQIGILKK